MNLFYTESELDAEYWHCYETRLAILCGDADPTPAQDKLARAEAEELVERLRHDRWSR